MFPPIRQRRSYPEAIDPVLIAREARGLAARLTGGACFPARPSSGKSGR